MLSIRIFHLLVVGFCLFLIAQYMRFMHVTVHGLDRLMSRRFFDIEKLTRDIRVRAVRDRGGPAMRDPVQAFMWHSVYLWLCRRLRRAAGLDPGND